MHACFCMMLDILNEWSSALPISDIFSISSLQKCSNFSLRWDTDLPTSSKEWRELTVMLGESVDPGGKERDWKLYTDTKKQEKHQLKTQTFDRNTISVQHALPFLKTTVLFSRSLLPGGNGCDGLCVKAAPAQRFSSSDLQSPAPVAPVVLQLDSLQPSLELWSAVSPQSGFSQWSGSDQ